MSSLPLCPPRAGCILLRWSAAEKRLFAIDHDIVWRFGRVGSSSPMWAYHNLDSFQPRSFSPRPYRETPHRVGDRMSWLADNGVYVLLLLGFLQFVPGADQTWVHVDSPGASRAHQLPPILSRPPIPISATTCVVLKCDIVQVQVLVCSCVYISLQTMDPGLIDVTSLLFILPGCVLDIESPTGVHSTQHATS
jgi:hypothetical protein